MSYHTSMLPKLVDQHASHTACIRALWWIL